MDLILKLLRGVTKLMRSLLTLSYTLELSEKQLQRRIDSLGIFPVKNKRSLLTVIAADPILSLNDAENLLGIELTLKVQIRPILSMGGRVMMQAAISYDSQTGEFRLDDPRVSQLKIKGLPGEYADVVREILEAIAVGVLAGITVYKFQTEDRYQRIAKRLLKKVSIENQKLNIRVGLF